MARFAVQAVRGSSSRGGAGALRGLLKALKKGNCALMAVDGPRGPRGEVKPGIVYLARRTGVPVYPVSVAVSRGRRLARAWDQFLLPGPWARTVVCFGEPWRPEDGVAIEAQCAALAEALHGARREALANLEGARELNHIERPSART